MAAVHGNFDDAQTGVKHIFAEVKPTEKAELSSANSINIGRLAPQIIYYWYAWATLCRAGKINPTEPVNFSVPTGNFGDILAGYFAKCMGLPVGKLLCASNANNVLTEFLTTGRYDRRRPFYKTSSPSMDILVSSNLERLLYLASGGDAKMVAEKMQEPGRTGVVSYRRYAAEKDTEGIPVRMLRRHNDLRDDKDGVGAGQVPA